MLLLLALLGCDKDAPSTVDSDPATSDSDDSAAPLDADGDGWAAPADCDDADPAVNPGAEELCGDGVDNDCDPSNDRGCREGGEVGVTEADLRVIGEVGQHAIGRTVVFVPDVDGDGADELLLRPYSEWDGWNQTWPPCVFMVFGGREEDVLESQADLTACSGGADDWGYDQAAPDWGDLDGDGAAEVVLGLIDRVGFFDPAREGVVDLDARLHVLASEERLRSLTPLVWRDAASGGVDWLLTQGISEPDGDAALHLFGAPIVTEDWEEPDVRVTVDDTWTLVNGVTSSGLGDLDGDGLSSMGLVGTRVSRPEDATTGGLAVLDAVPPDGAPLSDAVDHVIWGRGEDGADGGEHYDNSGLMLRPAGDVDGDGLDDVLLADRTASVGGVSGGCAVLFLSPLPEAQELADAPARICADDSYDHLGQDSDARGDLDGDGRADLLVGEWGDYTDEANNPVTRLFYGPISPGTHLGADADASFIEAAPDEHVSKPSAGGDFNGDGWDDVVIGAPSNSELEVGAGVAYLFFGGGP
ncbi:MAG: FG-GAP repeat protein [Alphaproteobacteria bacterium]|nr:FG-GAP repeat protein [Alphaproteobacteria bacterium]